MKLSIVTTLYKSRDYIKDFYRRASESAKRLTPDYEIVFVNDGSPDDSLAVALELLDRDDKVKVVDLSRNFGHHRAILCGLEHSSGDLVYLLDSDLEEQPEWLESFYQTLLEQEADLVAGVQAKRRGGLVKSLGGYLFYLGFRFAAPVSVPAGVTVARLMSRRFVDALLLHEESEIFFAGLCVITGFRQTTITVEKQYKGKTSYCFYKRTMQAVDAVTSFSNRPLYAMFFLGWFVFLFSVSYITWVLIHKIFFKIEAGFVSVVASIWSVGGLMMICTGMIGIYLGKIFSEVKRRPVIVKARYGFNDDRNSR